MKFYEFRQNNSGGRFVVDPERGISVFVTIEAPNTTTARSLAENVGLYFDGRDDYAEERDSAPKEHTGWTDWVPGKPHGYTHFIDGRIEGVPFREDRR